MPVSTSRNRFRPVYHLTPKDDTYKHIVDAGGTCWCCPTKDDDDPEEVVFTHHAYDRREDYEEGWRKPH